MGSWLVFVRAHVGAWAVLMLMAVAVPGMAAASDGDARTILILSSEDSLHQFARVTTDAIVKELNDSISARRRLGRKGELPRVVREPLRVGDLLQEKNSGASD